MASIQIRKESGTLIIDFYYQGFRCREQTALPDTPANRKRLEKVLSKIEEAISMDSFDYRQFFPTSKNVSRFETSTGGGNVNADLSGAPIVTLTPLFKDFVETWFNEKVVEWRKTHQKTIRSDLDKRLIPHFGEMEVGRITKADILSYRADLAKVQARGKDCLLANPRINKILNPLRQVLCEAADRFDFRTPFQNIKQLRIKKTDVYPFTLPEVKLLLETVREDFKNYFTIRFFTGLRTGEINGLKWKYVDFDNKIILIRETVVDGEDAYTKNDSSQRDIQMSQIVFDALKAQEQGTGALSEYVFCNRDGKPLDQKNVTNRVWHPLLRLLAFKKRRPYQCRHTAATLWLASGESPEWIARQLGHTTTEMLFRIYSRFVPNLTRQDGSAFERMLLQAGSVQAKAVNEVMTNMDQPNDEGEEKHG